MFGAILKALNSSFKKVMAFCHGIYVMKVMKLLAFIFEQPSYEFSWSFAMVESRCFPYFIFKMNHRFSLVLSCT